jgi:hypothetical protein
MGQQISGALGIPLVRLFGQSPSGLNSTGESDMRNYYDMIRSQQQRKFRHPVDIVLRVAARSSNINIPDDFSFSFRPLWQLKDQEKIDIANRAATTVIEPYTAGVIRRVTVLKELKQQSRFTGYFTNITEEEIEEAEQEPLGAPGGEEGQEMPGFGGGFLPGGQNQEPPLPEQEQEPAGFLPGPSQQTPPSDSEDDEPEKRHSFLPGGMRTILGAGGENSTDIKRKPKKPILHVHTSDQNLPGRRVRYAGFDVVVEVDKGWPRRAGSSGGATMAAPYGYFPGTIANDGDALDVFLGEDETAPNVYVIDQCNPYTR